MRSIRLLERDLAIDLSLNDVARAIGLSPSRFHHLFAQDVGEPPDRYLRRIRLDAAAQRLQWTQEPIDQVGFQLGYASQAAFTRAFKRRFQTTPAAFRSAKRKQHQMLDAEDGRPVSLIEMESARCVARRFTGSAFFRAVQCWAEFDDALSRWQPLLKSSIYIGLRYDDPRVTPEAQLRYDCCVPVGPDFPDPAGKAGLHLIHLAPCRYVSTQHAGPFDTLFGTFCTLLDHWIPRNNFTIMDDPAVETYLIKPTQLDVQDMQCSVLIPVV